MTIFNGDAFLERTLRSRFREKVKVKVEANTKAKKTDHLPLLLPFLPHLQKGKERDNSTDFPSAMFLFFLARCCLSQVPGGAPFSQRSELATACTSRMQIKEPYKTN